MPELPEVETVRRGLAPAMEGRILENIVLNRPNLRFPFPPDLKAVFDGSTITSLGRRAKYLLIENDNGAILICHLGMSGSFRVVENSDVETVKDTKHDHVIFQMQSGIEIKYNDPRRFGFMDLCHRTDLESNKFLRDLGIEPTGNLLDAGHVAMRFQGKKAPLKAALLDQRIIAGLGNIYVCEALFRAGLSPERPAKSLVTKSGKASIRLFKLVDVIREVIAEAIAAGGSSLKDHVQTDGTLGYFQHRFKVYDQENNPCSNAHCTQTIARMVQSGRSTFYCPDCQK